MMMEQSQNRDTNLKARALAEETASQFRAIRETVESFRSTVSELPAELTAARQEMAEAVLPLAADLRALIDRQSFMKAQILTAQQEQSQLLAEALDRRMTALEANLTDRLDEIERRISLALRPMQLAQRQGFSPGGQRSTAVGQAS